MTEKYFTRFEGDDIVVTRKSDRKTLTVTRGECEEAEIEGPAHRVAIAIAKACDDSNWG